MRNTNAWSLVIQRAASSWVDIWVGNLFAKSQFPLLVRIELLQVDKLCVTRDITSWKRPFQYLEQGIYALNRIDDLQANTQYHVNLYVQLDASRALELVKAGVFTTLPNVLPGANEKPFTIGFGSCFSNQDDFGQTSTAYAALYDAGGELSPDVTFLIGDQVYLDLGFLSLVPFGGYIRKRIAKRYANNWQDLTDVFTRGATWMLPDDHEYWNDYPFNNLPILALQSLKLRSVRKHWVTAANDGINNIQSARMLEIFSIGDELSICLANLRSERNEDGFISEESFTQLASWAASLRCPGVLVIQQLLLDELGPGERNLPSFTEQYARLVEALAASGQDIMVLTGDVHCGRIASVALGKSGATLTEVVSSPLSNLKGLLNGLGAGVAGDSPEYFPPIDVDIAGVSKTKINYPQEFRIGHLPGRHFTNYPIPRTEEHFMTVAFSRSTSGEVEVAVRAWKIRQLDLATGLPVSGFTEVFRTRLRSAR